MSEKSSLALWLGYAWLGLASRFTLHAPRTPVLFVGPADALNQSEPQFPTREISVIINIKFPCPFRAPNYSRNTTLYNIQYDTMQYNETVTYHINQFMASCIA